MQFHAKIVIEEGANSPVSLLLSFKGNPDIFDLYVYGSYSVKKPSADTNTDLSVKNIKRIIIPEPSGKLKFLQKRNFYLTFETLQTT